MSNLFFNFIRSRSTLCYFLFKTRDLLFPKTLKKSTISELWQKRIDDVLIAEDNQFIPRVPNAGQYEGTNQIMYNGLRIKLGSYYSQGNHLGGQHKLLELNTGVHEPQEERVFHEVLKYMPANATMIELGSFWSFYSMCFNKEVQNAQNYMVEPIAENLYCGKSNFKLNNMNGHFTQAFVGKASANPWYSIKTICIDDFIEKHKIEKLNILHSDIQGYEYDMLLGAERSITKGIIDYIFISTHSNELHNTCRDFLINHQYEIIADANLDQTFSFDGLIVGRLKSITGLGKVPIQLKKAA